MAEMDRLLSAVENPTRRRILEALTRGPHYAFQLAKELGISQPAIVKHLNMLEEQGMVKKHQEDSRIGPKRTVYLPDSEFTLMLDMRNGMFAARLILPSDGRSEPEAADGLDDARASISEIDRRMEEVERMRCDLIRRRESLIRGMMDRVPDDGFGDMHRSLLYSMLNDPEGSIDAISMRMSINADRAKMMMNDIQNEIKEKGGSI